MHKRKSDQDFDAASGGGWKKLKIPATGAPITAADRKKLLADPGQSK